MTVFWCGLVQFYTVPRPAPAVPLPEFRRQNLPFSAPQPALRPPSCWDGLSPEHTEPGMGTRMAELRRKSQERAKGCLESAGPPLHWDSLLSPFHRTRNRNRSRTSLGHFSFPICFSTFLSLSRSSCSPSPAVSTGTGWKQGSNRSDRVSHLLMSSVPGVDGKPLPRRSCPWLGEPLVRRAGSPTALPRTNAFVGMCQICSCLSCVCTQRAS